jgi:DNA-binding CsgD family transcriptional regulator
MKSRLRLVDPREFRRQHKDLINLWQSMLNRCYRKNVKAFEHYGGRGIRVCERWWIFENFLNDMPPRPKGHTLERIDNDGEYCPENCRWATMQEQALNKRNSRMLTADGKTQPMAAWARELGVNPAAILYRLNAGWSVRRAVTTPAPERPNAKLSMKEAKMIRRLYPSHSAQKIADRFGVSKKTVLNILHERTFA